MTFISLCSARANGIGGSSRVRMSLNFSCTTPRALTSTSLTRTTKNELENKFSSALQFWIETLRRRRHFRLGRIEETLQMAHARRVAQFPQSLRLDLADAFARDVIHLADFFERAF